jgi:RNA polymerase sigma factor (sigma-70 family)
MARIASVQQRGDEADLYLLHHEHLVRSVARTVGAPRALIEDACQTAWLILLRRQPDRTRVFGWLRTVAVREAYRLCGADRRDVRLDVLGADGRWRGGESIEDPRACVERQVTARAALQRLAELPPRQRRLFALQVAGFTYRETAAVTGDSVRTVDRQLRRAHAHVQRQPA